MRLSLLLYTSLLLPVASAYTPKDVFPLPDSVLSGFKHIDAKAFAKILEAEFFEKDNVKLGTSFCLFTYCHGDTDCSELCATLAPKINDTIWGERLRTLDNSKQPDADQGTCVKECAIECGRNDCTKECPKLCEIHFSFKNRKEYEAEYYQFMTRFIDYARSKIIPVSLLTGYKHLNARAFAEQVLKDKTGADAVITFCRFTYCHGENRDGCSDMCAIEICQHINKQPDADQATCEKECEIECGKSDCTKECPKLCGIHWSYENRKEYEAEYYQFNAKLVEYISNIANN